MKKYLVYLKNGGVCKEAANCIIVRNDYLFSNLVCFMREDGGYSFFSETDIRAVYEYKDGAVEYINLADVTEMNTNEFCNYLHKQ